MADADALRAVRAVADAFVANDAVGTCIGASMLLAERRHGVVVEGYLVNDRARCGCRHYWYREDGVDYDVATMIYRRHSSRAREGVVDTDAASTRVSECLPSAEAAHPSCGYALVSSAEDRATAALFAAWSRDSRRAWAGCPRWLHALRGDGAEHRGHQRGGACRRRRRPRGRGDDPKDPHSKNRAFLLSAAFVGPAGCRGRRLLLVACLVCALYALLRAWCAPAPAPAPAPAVH